MPRRAPRCTACDLHEGCASVRIDPDGPEDADVLFVGEAPGTEEDEQGSPFQGKSGRLMRQAAEVYLKGTSARFTLAVRCKVPGGAKPSAKQRKACVSEHLLKEIERTQPKLIVAVGDIPVRALTGHGGVLKNAGRVEATDHGKVMALPGPGYVRRNEAYRDEWERIISTIPAILAPPPTDLDYRLLRTKQEIQHVLAEARKWPLTAFDYETTGVDPWRGEVISVAISGAPGRAYCFDPNLAVKEWQAWLASERPKIAHHLSFEDVWSRVKFGTRVKNCVHDTYLAARLIDENKPSDLKRLALEHTPLGDFGSDMKADMENPEYWAKRTIGDLWEYNCFDADATLRVALAQSDNPELDEGLLLKSILHVQTMVSCKVTGIGVNESRLRDAEKKASAQLDDAMAALRTNVHVQVWEETRGPINVASPSMGELLTKWMKIPIKVKTDSGKPSCRSRVLEHFVDDFPIVEHVIRAKKARVLLQTFIPNTNDLLRDGVLHPNWNIGAADTWRISASSPSLQNQPKIDWWRAIYEAVNPEWVFFEIDYSQVELRVLASLTGENSWIDAYANARDLHAETAARVFECALDKVTSSLRSRAKSINFGIAYGITAKGMEEQFGIPQEEAEPMLEQFWATHPAIRAWITEQHNRMKTDGYVLSAFGRKRRLKGTGRDKNKAGNHPVQSTAAELTLDALVEIEAELGDEYLIGQVHDSVIGQAPADEVQEIVRQCSAIMERQGQGFMKVPLVADAEWGPRWGETNVS